MRLLYALLLPFLSLIATNCSQHNLPVSKSVVEISVNTGTGRVHRGTGWLFKDHHTIITCTHVVAKIPVNEIYITFENSQPLNVTNVVDYPNSDITKLTLDSDTWTATPLQISSKSPLIGDPVYGYGYPLNLINQVMFAGHVNQYHTEQADSNSEVVGGRYIGIDCEIEPGHSGSPVFDQQSKVVGMVDWRYSNYSSLNFCISQTNLIKLLH